ncbi:unnamed protein product [Chrysoparadoxa australica]
MMDDGESRSEGEDSDSSRYSGAMASRQLQLHSHAHEGGRGRQNPRSSASGRETDSHPSQPQYNYEQWQQQLQSPSVSERCPRSHMNKLVMNYLIMEGFAQAAESFASESNTEPIVDLKTIKTRLAINDAVMSGGIDEGVRLVQALDPGVLRDPEMMFTVQRQRLLELIKAGQVEEALNLAASELAPVVEASPELLKRLEEVLTLLAFPEGESRSKCPLAWLLEASERDKTARALNTAILRSQYSSCEASTASLHLPTMLATLVHEQSKLLQRGDLAWWCWLGSVT